MQHKPVLTSSYVLHQLWGLLMQSAGQDVGQQVQGRTDIVLNSQCRESDIHYNLSNAIGTKKTMWKDNEPIHIQRQKPETPISEASLIPRLPSFGCEVRYIA